MVAGEMDLWDYVQALEDDFCTFDDHGVLLTCRFCGLQRPRYREKAPSYCCLEHFHKGNCEIGQLQDGLTQEPYAEKQARKKKLEVVYA